MQTLEPNDHQDFESRYQPPATIVAIEWLTRAHEQKLDLCRELEEIADSLPSEVNREKCLNAAKAIGPLTKGAHRFEENVLFPWIEKNVRNLPQMHSTLERLKAEHWEDECFIEELVDTLLTLGAGKQPSNPEATGYMLRGFFIGIRRHIAFEREHLLGLVDVTKLN
jgi:hemerythrin-like domain-containing protein